MAVKAEMEETGKNQVRIRVEVPAEDIGKAVDRAFREIAREVTIPGFRKGKVPRRVLQARLGMDTIYGEVKQANLPEYYAEALEQLGIEPIDEPDIDIDEIEIEEGKPMVFEATVEIRPRVELKGYKGVEVERPDEEVTDEEVSRVLDNMREKFAQLDRSERHSGLGLTFCKLVMEKHCGQIGVDSAPGEGSQFWIRLPA